MELHEVELFRKAMKLALGTLEKTFDVKVHIGNIKYDSSAEGGLVAKVEIAKINQETGDIVTEAGLKFKANCFRWGLKPEDLFREFEHNGKRYKIVGGRPRARKQPIVAKCLTD